MKQTQRDIVIGLLRKNGSFGISSYDLTFIYRIKQAPTRIHELQKMGHVITTVPHQKRSVKYILVKDANPPIVQKQETPEPIKAKQLQITLF